MRNIYLGGIIFLMFMGCGSPKTPAEVYQERYGTPQSQREAQNETNVEPEIQKPMEYVILNTNKGDITLELDPNKAPITVENFLNYVDDGHYDGTIFHRVISNFMIQGGGFTPEGDQKPTDAPIVLESNNGLVNRIGTIAMARTNSPNSATSQFFINVSDNDFLDYSGGNPGYAVFGKVTSGMEVVNEIRMAETRNFNGHNDWPVEDIIILKAGRENNN